jgi:thioredoxin 1
MVERLIVVLIIIVFLGLLWLGWRYYKAKLIQTIHPIGFQRGKPALLYFTGEYCITCKVQQKPIVDQITAKFGDQVVVKEYDVSEHPGLAGQYRVLTLPTTVVLNQAGQVKHINYGLAGQAQLEQQLSL